MTTPAVTISESTRNQNVSGKITWWNPPSGGPRVTAVTGGGYLTHTYRQRPASGTSPIRADGSRAPRAWNHSWRISYGIPSSWGANYTTTNGTRSKTLQMTADPSLGCLIPANPQLSFFSAVCSQVGAPWLLGGDIDSFPLQSRLEAVTRFRLKALDQKADLGVTLGELRSTARFLKELCNGVSSTVHKIANRLDDRSLSRLADRPLREVRNLSKREKRKLGTGQTVRVLQKDREVRRRLHESQNQYRRRLATEKSIIQQWMTYQFAVKPLVMDLVSATEALSYWAVERKQPFRCTVKSGAEQEIRGHYILSRSFLEGLQVQMTQPYVAKYNCHYSGVFSVDPSTDRDVRSLGLGNPGLVAWELVQFSWLCDYAIGIGDWIKQMTSLDHMQWIEGCVSLLGRLNSADSEVSLKAISPSGAETFGRGLRVTEVGRFARIVLTKTPGPAALPLPKKRLGLTQVANALGALTGLLDTRNLRI